MSYQLFAALDDATRAALRASIELHGVLLPIVVDQHGQIIDGHHRLAIAQELGVEHKTQVEHVESEGHGRELARTLNADRRHLTPQQRRPLVHDLRERGHSQRAIAGALGVSQRTIEKDLAAQVTTGSHLNQSSVRGLDGKSYPARRARQADPPSSPHVVRLRRLDPERVLTNSIHALRGLRTALEIISVTDAPVEVTVEFVTELRQSISFFRGLIRTIEESR